MSPLCVRVLDILSYCYTVMWQVMPWSLVERELRATHSYEVFALRSMLAVPFFEKQLYELPEDQVCVCVMSLCVCVCVMSLCVYDVTTTAVCVCMMSPLSCV